MAVKTGPSFMSRLGGQMPGMVNSLAQNYGDQSMAETVRGSSSLLGKQKAPQRPKTLGMPSQLPGQQVPVGGLSVPQAPAGNMWSNMSPGVTSGLGSMFSGGGGINTGPSNMGVVGQGGLGPIEYMGQPMPQFGGQGGGLFDTYNRMRDRVRF
jgi:hypothetical protein